MSLRPYRGGSDADALWELKRAFELGLGSETGADSKADLYAEKLSPEYREKYLAWVDRCVEREAECVQLATIEERDAGDEGDVVGYAFLLPESHAYIWDAAVLNEIYVRPEHRGTGIGDELLEAALGHAQTQDLPLDRIVLDVDGSNKRAKAFYARHGFDRWGEMVARDL